MIVLGIGSNLHSSFGDRFENINKAISYLESNNIKILVKSSYYETPSYPNQKDPKFINMVISIKTQLNPVDLMSVLIHIEEKLGRKRVKKNDPRTCDIDIIDYNGEIKKFNYRNLDLELPHKKLEFRNFVLYPLEEIYPEWRHPKTKVIISSLIEKLPEIDRKSILKVKKN